jgi:hypothetical protein
MVATPTQITIKASPVIQMQVAQLLEKLREQRHLFVRHEYCVVESARIHEVFSKAERGSTFILLDEPTVAAIEKDTKAEIRVDGISGEAIVAEKDLKELLALCTQTASNGSKRVWIGPNIGSLPAVRVGSTLTPDHKSATLTITISNDQPAARPKRVVLTLPSGRTAAIPLNDQHTQWLVFKTETLRKELKPA